MISTFESEIRFNNQSIYIIDCKYYNFLKLSLTKIVFNLSNFEENKSKNIVFVYLNRFSLLYNLTLILDFLKEFKKLRVL